MYDCDYVIINDTYAFVLCTILIKENVVAPSDIIRNGDEAVPSANTCIFLVIACVD